jgi:hypothetical protein
MQRHCVATCFSLAVVGCASFQPGDPALSPQSASAPVIQENDAIALAEHVRMRVGHERHACPSPDFSKFLHAFSNRADLQRQFTTLPLEYGQLDPDAIGAGREEYRLRTIEQFEKIPSFDVRSGGTIMPNERRRTKEHERLVVERTPEDPEYPRERQAPDDMVARLFIDDTGFHIYYRFQRADGCWFLRAIHDKSI